MTDLRMEETSPEDLAQREVLAAEPGRFDTVRRALFERPSTCIALAVVILFVLSLIHI